MAMKPITSFFNSPPSKNAKGSTVAGIQSFFKKSDGNCNGHSVQPNILPKNAEVSALQENGIQQNGAKNSKLSRKKSLAKEAVEQVQIVEMEGLVKPDVPESEGTNFKDMSSVEMSYEDFLTVTDTSVTEETAADEISVIQSPDHEDSSAAIVIDENDKEVPPVAMETEDGQDMFSEDVVAGCPSVKQKIVLKEEKSGSKVTDNAVVETADTSTKTVKEKKKSSKLSRKVKKDNVESNDGHSEHTVEKKMGSTELASKEKSSEKSEVKKDKSAKRLSKSKTSGKQMTLFGKVIENVPKLESEDDSESKQENEGIETVECIPTADVPKSKSIMNFFSKVDKKFPNGKKAESEKITCKAEVHTLSCSKTSGETKKIIISPDTSPEAKKVSPRLKSNVAVEKIDMSITELGSQVITVTETRKRSRRKLSISSALNENDSQRHSDQNKPERIDECDQSHNTRIDVNPSMQKDEHESIKSKGDNNKETQEVKSDKLDTTDDDLVIISTEDKSETDQTQRKAQLANQLAYLDTVKVSVKKTTQATLNFSGKGSLIQKAPVEKEMQEEITEESAKEVKSEDSDFEIVACENLRNKEKKKKGGKLPKKTGKQRKEMEKSITPPQSRLRRRQSIESPAKTPSKRVYLAKILPPRRNSLPGLRMKFTQIRAAKGTDKEGSPNIEELVKLTAKMSKAQQILDKAKKASHVKTKARQRTKSQGTKKVSEKQKQTDVEEITSPSLRRSSRHSSVVARTAIAECLSPSEFLSPKGKQKKEKRLESDCKTPSKTPKSGKNRHKSGDCKTPSRTPKRKVKLASIFKGKGEKQEGSDDDVEVTKVHVDPEVLRVRREFLLSGVPETLKKQAEVNCAINADDHPPLPEISHVQQCPAIEDSQSAMFSLKSIKLPNTKADVDYPVLDCLQPHRMCKGSLTQSAQHFKLSVQLNGVEDKPFEKETLKYLLAEVSSRNPNFPVRRVYKQLTKKYELTKGTWVEPTQPEKEEPKESKNNKKRKLNLGETDEPKRRSKRRRAASDAHFKSDEDDCAIVEEENTKPENLDKSRELLWTDKYSPSSSTEVLANSMHSKRLKTWLEEWRDRTDLEVKKIKKQLMKEAKKDSKFKEEIQKSLGDSWWTDDESDFEIDTEDDSDCDEEDLCDGLSNTMVLSGLHGVGKTAMVYAVAQELGYKIFEVNASSKRAGKQMLAELQEATQSHQVAQHNMDKLFTTFKMIQTERRKSLEVAKPDKKMNSMFSNFFTSNKGPAQPAQPKQKTKEKKTPAKTPPKTKKSVTPGKSKGNADHGQISQKKGLKLNSTSLILFEEVDVIFEEDKGFWTAIETFMNTTKRPIILTASDPKVFAAVNRRHEVIKIRPSPMLNVASYLQLICLAEKLRADHEDIKMVVKNCGGDLRRAILTLQYLILSGAGSSKMAKPIKYSPAFFNKKQENAPVQFGTSLLRQVMASASADSGKDSEEEFKVTTSKKRRRPVRPMIDSGDDSSNASPVKPLKMTNLQVIQSDSAAEESQDGMTNVTAVTENELSVAPVTAPHIHGLLWHGSSGAPMQGLTSNADILQVLQNPVTSDQAWSLVNWYLSSKVNLIYANLMQLLDLPKVQLISPRMPSFASKPEVKKRRRIKMNSDIFDCEDSNDDEENSKDAEPESKMEVDVDTEKTKEVDNQNNMEEDHKESCVATVEDAIAASSVKILSDLYDNLSYTDAYLNCETSKEGLRGHNQPFNFSSGQLCPGLTDGHRYDNHLEDNLRDSFSSDLQAGVLVYSIHKTNMKLQQLKQKMETLDASVKKKASKCLCLPVPSETLNSLELRLTSECASQDRLTACRKQAVDHLSSCMPLCVQCNHKAVTMDVMPYVRNMCQTEQLRQVSNTKRRFTHYLDSISLGITRKQNVIDVLCTSFT